MIRLFRLSSTGMRQPATHTGSSLTASLSLVSLSLTCPIACCTRNVHFASRFSEIISLLSDSIDPCCNQKIDNLSLYFLIHFNFPRRTRHSGQEIASDGGSRSLYTHSRALPDTHTSASLLASQHRHLSAAVAAFVRRPKTTNCLLTNDSNHNHPHHHYMQFYRDSHDFPESFHQKHDLITTCAVWIVLSEEASLCSAPLSLLSLSLFLRCVLVIISLPLASSDGACSRAGSLPPSGLRGLSAQTTLRTLSL